MSETPRIRFSFSILVKSLSKRRRKGREAFVPGGDPMDFQPYKKGTFAYDSYLNDWLDGWKEAEEVYNQEIENEEPGACPCCGRKKPEICPVCGREIP